MRNYRAGTLPSSEFPIGTRRVRSDGYVNVKAEHGWQLEHRVVAEMTIGRGLETWEHVHHMDGDRANNSPDNLSVMTNAEHQRFHDHLGVQHAPRFVTLVCQHCGVEYEVKAYKRDESKYCSNACRMPAMWEARRHQAAALRQAS
ncbi:HNH endonuclease signature motif containing protein [Streptomyces sp. NPDC057686]|uniref:HNH endonuclease signature motif containing protein n=1 Tax=Streptomyces sp. NPDC057686 TaxID=3346212 RepID=UPI0036782A06